MLNTGVAGTEAEGMGMAEAIGVATPVAMAGTIVGAITVDTADIAVVAGAAAPSSADWLPVRF